MAEKIYEAQATLAQLAQALEDARLLWVYAKRLEDIVLDARPAWLAAGVPLERWDQGCAFGPELELCWQRRGDTYEVRAITEAPPPEVVAWIAWDMGGWRADDGALARWLLVGERDADRESGAPTWSEARIPRYLAYPVPDPTAPPERVALVARVYRCDGLVALHRLVCVEGG